MIAFGPVPSRRLGRSLGINNIPPKVCTYSCVYCQVGRTTTMQIERSEFYSPNTIFENVNDKVNILRKIDSPVDYLTFVPDGEPTLDIHLGPEIKLLKSLGIKIGVITNASLIWREDVREELMGSDWVSVKIDAIQEDIWHRVNRNHRYLQMDAILAGVLEFKKDYNGVLVTETMLVDGLNDSTNMIRGIADFLDRLKPDCAYLAVPIRPPAEKWVKSTGEMAINRAFQILNEKIDQVEYLIGYEGNAFAFTGDVAEDLLSITSVHPMRRDAVQDFLIRAGADWADIRRLIDQNRLVEMEYEGKKYYMRKLPEHSHETP
ncbi:radical SAM protein [bacterium]|nr:radical SAM protein [candidate division CSSED10-310 bacterium]